MRAGVNALTATFVVGVLAGLVLTPDGREWLRHPTVMLGGQANASASPPGGPAPVAPVVAPEPPVAAVTPLSARLAQGPLRIGVFGDSMADGLYAGLYRDLRDQPKVTVTKFSEVSTGLSRYDYVDIQAKTGRQIAETPIDVAVYWVGLPRMKSGRFDGRMSLINGVVEARMRALGVPYLETTGLTSNEEGGYEAYLPNKAGRRTLMRAIDMWMPSLARISTLRPLWLGR